MLKPIIELLNSYGIPFLNVGGAVAFQLNYTLHSVAVIPGEQNTLCYSTYDAVGHNGTAHSGLESTTATIAERLAEHAAGQATDVG